MKLVKIENTVPGLGKTHGKRSTRLVLRILCHSGIIWLQFSIMRNICFPVVMNFKIEVGVMIEELDPFGIKEEMENISW